MNNRVYLILIIVLSGALLLVGAGLIGGALYLQGRMTTAAPAAAAFPTAVAADGLITPNAPSGGGMPQEGDAAPEFQVKGLKGETINLSDYHGKPIILNFWATWCGPCTAEMKNIEQVYQAHKSDDIVILAVNQGEYADQVSGYKDLWRLNFNIVMDAANQGAHLFHIQALPTTVFIDRDGKISEVHVGGPMSVDFIEARVKKLLAQTK